MFAGFNIFLPEMKGRSLIYKNGLQAYTSFLAASIMHKPVISGMPPSISFELSGYCNLRCPECPSGSGRMTRGRGFMSISLFSRIIDDIKPFLFNTNLYFQGEPMLHPEFFEFLERSRDTYTTVSTNGHFINPDNSEKLVCSGLDKLIISVDGMDQETYSLYRVNGNLDTVLKGLRSVAEAKEIFRSDINITVQFLVNRVNQHQISQIRKMTKELNVNLALKSMQLSDKESIEFWLPSLKAFRRYREVREGYSLRSHLPRRCLRLWINPVITWDGKVLPCCFDKDGKYIMGDLNKNSFREIWHGKKFAEFRKRVLSEREKIEICMNCTSGLTGVKK